MAVSRAWLLDFGRNLRALVGANEMSQVLLSSELHEIPCTPFYANELLVFEGEMVPVLDVPSLVEGYKDVDSRNDVIGIALYQLAVDEPVHYGGLRLTTMPANIFVDDEQFCELPQTLEFWQPALLSCVMMNEAVVPIIDFGRLFSGELNHEDFRQS